MQLACARPLRRLKLKHIPRIDRSSDNEFSSAHTASRSSEVELIECGYISDFLADEDLVEDMHGLRSIPSVESPNLTNNHSAAFAMDESSVDNITDEDLLEAIDEDGHAQSTALAPDSLLHDDDLQDQLMLDATVEADELLSYDLEMSEDGLATDQTLVSEAIGEDLLDEPVAVAPSISSRPSDLCRHDHYMITQICDSDPDLLEQDRDEDLFSAGDYVDSLASSQSSTYSFQLGACRARSMLIAGPPRNGWSPTLHTSEDDITSLASNNAESLLE